MRTQLAGAALLFIASLAVFLTRGLGAYAEGREAAEALAIRVAGLERLRGEVPLVSHAEVEALAAERTRLAGLIDLRRSQLTGSRPPAGLPGLIAALDRSPLTAVAEGEPLRAELLAAAEGRPRLDAALAQTFEALRGTGIEQLESLELGELEPVPVPGVPRLMAYEFELVVVSEVPEVLDLLETLVPGRTSPVVTVSGASVRRIEPALWSSVPEGLTSPPVRLWLNLSALVAAQPEARRR